MKKALTNKVIEDICADVDSIPWCELNLVEKDYIRIHERLAISIAKQLRQRIPTFIGIRGKGKYLS